MPNQQQLDVCTAKSGKQRLSIKNCMRVKVDTWTYDGHILMQVAAIRKSVEDGKQIPNSPCLKMEEPCQARLMLKSLINRVSSTSVTVSAEDLKESCFSLNYTSKASNRLGLSARAGGIDRAYYPRR